MKKFAWFMVVLLAGSLLTACGNGGAKAKEEVLKQSSPKEAAQIVVKTWITNDADLLLKVVRFKNEKNKKTF